MRNITDILGMAKECIYGLRNECDLEGLRGNVRFDCWLKMSDEMLLILNNAIKENSEKETKAWLVEFTDDLGSKRRSVHLHNCIAYYKRIDPSVKFCELIKKD